MSDERAAAVPVSLRALSGAALAVAALTALELVVVGLSSGRTARIAALLALLLAKVAIVLTAFMRVGASWRSARLTVVALFAAVGFAIVLMLDAAARGGLR